MAKGKVSKNAKVTVANSAHQIKRTDPREEYLSTKQELVVADLSDKFKINFFYGVDSNEGAVLCEDQLGYYITSKSYVDAPILDGYRQYKRSELKIEKMEATEGTEADENKKTEFTITFGNGNEIVISL
jgi:hypothetical protein